MNVAQRAVYNMIIKDLELTYRAFLRAQKIETTGPVVRAGFMVALEDVISRDPIPDPAVQAEVLKYVQKDTEKAVNEYLESVELTFFDVAQRHRDG